MNIVQEEVEKILQLYAKGKHLNSLKKAKDIFASKTGKIDEDSEEYESRMSSFNDWYVFQYQLRPEVSVIQDYNENLKNRSDLSEALVETNYSAFLFDKINFRKQVIIKDILHNTKYVLAKDNGQLPLVEDDVFIGRLAHYNGQSYLLNGLCILPREILSSLKKECRKIRKAKNTEESEFLLNLERLKTKTIQYGHIDPLKIFTF